MNRLITGFDKDRLVRIFSWGIYLFVNLIFCIKYNPVAEVKVYYLLMAYPLFVWGVFKFTQYKGIQKKTFFFVLVAVFILLLAFLLMHYIDRYSVDVDRWSALAFWSENLRNGVFPYGTPTHMGGYASPYPVWQLFHFPFHLAGDTGYGQLFCLLVFFVFLYFNRKRLNSGAFVLLLALSPGFWWEMSVRSDLLCNILLVYVFLSAMFYYQLWEKHKYLSAVIVGLFLCTKMLVTIPLFLFMFPQFLHLSGKKKVYVALLVLAGWVIPFLPFLFGGQGILNHPEYNPMLQQTRQGNIWVVVILAVLMIFASLQWKTMRGCFFLSGLFLFLLIASVGIEITLSNDIHYTLFGDEFDVSYFNVSIPFFLYCINKKE
jgi:hypothetical protein